MRIESKSWEQTAQLLNATASITTDLGVEAGLATVPTFALDTLFPWLEEEEVSINFQRLQAPTHLPIPHQADLEEDMIEFDLQSMKTPMQEAGGVASDSSEELHLGEASRPELRAAGGM